MKVDLSKKRIGRIINYKLDKIIKLDISWNDLTELPDWINECINLQELHCDNNKLKKLPTTLPNSLQKLHCNHNELKELPTTLPNSLQYLNCGYNKLKELPTTLPNSLQYLNCDNNELITSSL